MVKTAAVERFPGNKTSIKFRFRKDRHCQYTKASHYLKSIDGVQEEDYEFSGQAVPLMRVPSENDTPHFHGMLNYHIAQDLIQAYKDATDPAYALDAFQHLEAAIKGFDLMEGHDSDKHLPLLCMYKFIVFLESTQHVSQSEEIIPFEKFPVLAHFKKRKAFLISRLQASREQKARDAVQLHSPSPLNPLCKGTTVITPRANSDFASGDAKTRPVDFGGSLQSSRGTGLTWLKCINGEGHGSNFIGFPLQQESPRNLYWECMLDQLLALFVGPKQPRSELRSSADGNQIQRIVSYVPKTHHLEGQYKPLAAESLGRLAVREIVLGDGDVHGQNVLLCEDGHAIGIDHDNSLWPLRAYLERCANSPAFMTFGDARASENIALQPSAEQADYYRFVTPVDTSFQHAIYFLTHRNADVVLFSAKAYDDYPKSDEERPHNSMFKPENHGAAEEYIANETFQHAKHLTMLSSMAYGAITQRIIASHEADPIWQHQINFYFEDMKAHYLRVLKDSEPFQAALSDNALNYGLTLLYELYHYIQNNSKFCGDESVQRKLMQHTYEAYLAVLKHYEIDLTSEHVYLLEGFVEGFYPKQGQNIHFIHRHVDGLSKLEAFYENKGMNIYLQDCKNYKTKKQKQLKAVVSPLKHMVEQVGKVKLSDALSQFVDLPDCAALQDASNYNLFPRVCFSFVRFVLLGNIVLQIGEALPENYPSAQKTLLEGIGLVKAVSDFYAEHQLMLGAAMLFESRRFFLNQKFDDKKQILVMCEAVIVGQRSAAQQVLSYLELLFKIPKLRLGSQINRLLPQYCIVMCYQENPDAPFGGAVSFSQAVENEEREIRDKLNTRLSSTEKTRYSNRLKVIEQEKPKRELEDKGTCMFLKFVRAQEVLHQLQMFYSRQNIVSELRPCSDMCTAIENLSVRLKKAVGDLTEKKANLAAYSNALQRRQNGVEDSDDTLILAGSSPVDDTDDLLENLRALLMEIAPNFKLRPLSPEWLAVNTPAKNDGHQEGSAVGALLSSSSVAADKEVVKPGPAGHVFRTVSSSHT